MKMTRSICKAIKAKIDSEIKATDVNYTRNKAPPENIENMSVAEIKQRLKQLGKPSKAKIKSKLISLLKEAMQELSN